MGKKVKKETEAPAADVFDPVNVETKNAKTAVLMLDSPEQEVLLKACESLYRFAEKGEENRVQIMQFGALEPLYALVKSEDKAVHRNAMMAFGILSCQVDVRRAMREMECTKVVMRLLDSEQEEPITNEFASLFFSSMATEYTNKVQLIEKGVMEPLVLLLTSPDPDVNKNAIEAISLLLHDYQSRAQVRQFEGIGPILELTKSEFPVIQQLSLEALAKISQDIENRDGLRELDALDHFVKFLGNKDWQDQHVNALLVLSNLLLDPETVEQLAESGGLNKFYELLTGEDVTPEVKVHACIAISRSAKNEDNRRVMHEQEMEKVLITLLTEGDDAQVKASAAKALGQLAESLTCKNFIGRNEGISPLLSQIKSNNEELRESASLCLANLTASNQYNCNEIFEKNGMDPLINLLSDTREACQANAATALTNLAIDEVIRSSMQALTVVSSLAVPMQSRSNIVQSRAAMCLASFCYDADARRELRDSGAITSLVKMLGSGNDEARRNACWAVAVAAADTETTSELCRAGAVTHLLQINQSTMRRSNFSELAMERVLDNYLPGKYSYLGHLGVNNLIGKLFYDAGALKMESELDNLENLYKRAVDDKREVLLVNPHQSDYGKEENTGAISEMSGNLEAAAAADSRKKGGNPKSAKGKQQLGKSKTDSEKGSRGDGGGTAATLDSEADTADNVASTFVAPEDHNLENIIKQVKTEIVPLQTTKEQIEALARLVCDKMGGQVSREDMINFPVKLHMAKLKTDLKTNVIPIGLIKTGTYYHRALLFKSLADRIMLPVTLDRGSYNRAWNVATLMDDIPPGGPKYPPKQYLIDLIHEPGEMHEIESQKAVAYQRL
ncbi:armadillo repeat-containing protein 3-like isoform X2 [Symsagittifera roscoffensis]|uniref:armadillo repeat-containing protein 3-like isoform X2 n=1 Tax=Symsagittifera roscoffensis TaxID=84072 RepID=UPI00307CA150